MSSASGDRGHQHPPVDLEPEPREPRLADEIGGGDPLLDASVQQGDDPGPFAAGEASMEELGGERRVGRKVQGVQDEGERLVDRVVGAVREAEPGLVEPGSPRSARSPRPS